MCFWLFKLSSIGTWYFHYLNNKRKRLNLLFLFIYILSNRCKYIYCIKNSQAYFKYIFYIDEIILKN